jgi:epoxyqueuosine reductase
VAIQGKLYNLFANPIKKKPCKISPMKKSLVNYNALAHQIKRWAQELGFERVGITDTHLAAYQKHYDEWLTRNQATNLRYMTEKKEERFHPEKIVPQACRVISVALNYFSHNNLTTPITRYAQGSDYHLVVRDRLEKLADKIKEVVKTFSYRACVDSSPVLEKALAEKAGLGWIGKNTLLTIPKAGSFYFLGELITDLPLPIDSPAISRCGTCDRCLSACPTQALISPYKLDVMRCIAYLTIEHRGIIPESLRSPIGTRIFGCKQCQIVCPWNRFATETTEEAFKPRGYCLQKDWVELFLWTEEEFLNQTKGTAIHRLGHERWLRNLAVALGNLPTSPKIVDALQARLPTASPLVQEHIRWALLQHQQLNLL